MGAPQWGQIPQNLLFAPCMQTPTAWALCGASSQQRWVAWHFSDVSRRLARATFYSRVGSRVGVQI